MFWKTLSAPLVHAARSLFFSRRRARLLRDYGRPPGIHYFDGDMENIRTYFDYRKANKYDAFLLDDITWNDLSMDAVFKRINAGLTTSGEQYLYYILRSPAVDAQTFDKRLRLIAFMEANPELRLKMQLIFSKLGRSRKADVCRTFNPARRGYKRLLLYVLLVAALLGCAAGLLFTTKALPFLVCFGLVNCLLHTVLKGKMERELATINYSVSMISAAHKIEKLHPEPLDDMLSPLYRALEKLKSVLRMGGLSFRSSDPVTEMVRSLFLADLIAYEYLKNKFWRCREELFTIHEYLGLLDASIAVASYRESVKAYAVPRIDFSGAAKAVYHAAELRHPLIENPVSNSLTAESSALVTGSNASGKSTFLKTVALNAIFAQSICTALCKTYSAGAFYIFSSMALTDDLQSGDSYYIAEIKSLKRIVDFTQSGKTVLCVIDEVLRGTNTVERIAASSEILSCLARPSVLCIAATHDIELCALLDGDYTLYHFQEQIDGNEMFFDYKLREGAAATRNAIQLLKIMGLDASLVLRAENRAARYLETGTWEPQRR